MFRLFLLALLLTQTFALAADKPPAAVRPVLRMGGFVVAPLMVGEPNEPIRGALPEFIMQEIAPKTNIDFVWLPPMTFLRAMQRIKEGSMDVVLLVSGPAAQTPNVARFKWTYLQTTPNLAVRVDSPLRQVADLHALAGMNIGWVGGSRLPAEFKGIAVNWQLMFTPNWQALNLRKLDLRRLDAAFYGNQYSPLYLARKENLAIRLVPLPMPAQTFEMAYSFKTDKAALAQFDAAATKAFANDGFKLFLESYNN